MKHSNLIALFLTFTAGQLIQLLTNAMAHNLYVSDPVLMCLTVGIVSTVVVVLAAVFTLMEKEVESGVAKHTPGQTKSDFSDVVPSIFRNWKDRPALDTDPIDIDEIDNNLANE